MGKIGTQRKKKTPPVTQYCKQVKRHKVAHISWQSAWSDLLDADCGVSLPASCYFQHCSTNSRHSSSKFTAWSSKPASWKNARDLRNSKEHQLCSDWDSLRLQVTIYDQVHLGGYHPSEVGKMGTIDFIIEHLRKRFGLKYRLPLQHNILSLEAPETC